MKKINRRSFIGRTSAGIAAGMVPATMLSPVAASCRREGSMSAAADINSAEGFAGLVEEYLPAEDLFSYHKRLTEEPVHKPGRDPDAVASEGEMTIDSSGWKLVCNTEGTVILQNAVRDFQDYLQVSQNVKVEIEQRSSLNEWQSYSNSIIVGLKDQIPGSGNELKGPKDYEILVTPGRIIVTGYDERGAMFGLYNLEARMNLREAPILPSNLRTVRHSLYQTRMALSWMGWMEWPDTLFAHMAHDGFDAIFTSVYANPNGDRTTAENSTDFYARLMYNIRNQNPGRMHDVIDRAAKFGIKVYTPIIYQYVGTPESEKDLRRLVREIIREFPDIKGYVLLTEGFWYKKWGGGHGASREYIEDWARNWCRAVAIVEEECHKVNPETEILPWEYNINFRADNADVKRYFIKQLPVRSIPLLTWENGKSFEIDGMKGHLRDYSLNQIGPAEVTEAQIEEAKRRKMKVYSKADSSTSWQYGSTPYLPCPYQWYDRYMALEKYGVKGTLESWTNGYKPNFISEIRAWTCWSDQPGRDDLFRQTASKLFGKAQADNVLRAWDLFSQAIRLVPDTGPNMGTNNAVGNPIFFQAPPPRTATFNRSWTDMGKWMSYTGSLLNPAWPYTVTYLIFTPDFSNKSNRAESYARGVSGIDAGPDTRILPVLLKYLKMAADYMDKGLRLYREAANSCPESKKIQAIREVIVAEHIERNMRSCYAILEFEDMRMQFVNEKDKSKAGNLLDKMEQIVRDEIGRTQLSLIAATHDSRLGFQLEQDYIYTPFSLKQKLEVLNETINYQIPDARKILSSKEA